MDLNISNVINAQVNLPGSGLSSYNTSNVGIISNEENEMTDPYMIALSPTEIEDMFGTESMTYKMSNAILNQSPNIKNGNGYIAVIPMLIGKQTITLSAAPASGTLTVNVGGTSVAIGFNSTAAAVQSLVRAISGFEKAVVLKDALVYTFIFYGTTGVIAPITQVTNTLEDGASDPVTAVIASVNTGETVLEATTRASQIVEFLGVLYPFILSDSDMLAVASFAQPLEVRKINFLVSNDEDSVEPTTGVFSQIKDAGQFKSRCLFYTNSEESALVMGASYAGRALSTNFAANNSTQTMHLKDLIGVLPDANMTQTLLNKAVAAGADCYVSIQGVPKVFTSGENTFFDRVYNLVWFIGELQIAYFNLLAQTSTKIPQTEEGMSLVKSVLRNVCLQAIANAFGAPGEWNSPDTFGPIEDFKRNIREKGFFIYTSPIALQSRADREARIAPVAQVALKEGGAVHKGNILININA